MSQSGRRGEFNSLLVHSWITLGRILLYLQSRLNWLAKAKCARLCCTSTVTLFCFVGYPENIAVPLSKSDHDDIAP